MSQARAKTAFTAEDYLTWEERSPGKYEYLAGEIFAMVGATDAHVTITMNLAVLLHAHVRGRPCRVYMADMKLRVDTADAFFYPDLLVTCAPEDHSSSRFKRQPTLLVEVLSATTAAFDRGQKFAIYRQLPSLREYVLIEQDRMSVECFRRDERNRWVCKLMALATEWNCRAWISAQPSRRCTKMSRCRQSLTNPGACPKRTKAE